MLSRRDVLQNLAYTSSALALTALTGTGAYAATYTGPRVRRDIGEMELDDPVIATYREGVRRMKELPADDPRSWIAQADIHRNSCPHGNWYFVPWHRSYLSAFEDVIRDLTATDDFALPYWDWTKDRQMPKALTDETVDGAPNPLFNPTRQRDPTESLPDFYVGQAIMDQVLAETDFPLFGSSQPFGQDSTDPVWQRRLGTASTFEGTPHGGVHVWIGGDMGVVPTAARDPIFWLHHGNIDRYWAGWNGLGNANPGDELWRDFVFPGNFVDPNGQPLDFTVSDLETTAALGYVYDRLPTSGAALIAMAARAESLLPRQPLRTVMQLNERSAGLNQVLNLPISIGTDEQELAMTARTDALGIPTGQRVLARLKDVDAPMTANAIVRVFINCSYLSPATPTTDPHYVGVLSLFFGAMADQAKPSYMLDLTPALNKLRRAKEIIGDQLVVQLLPLSVEDRDAASLEVQPAEVELLFV